ncbi:MAG: hypothetical protein ACLQSR_10610 [Limisphaerales bacterium]
MKTPREIILERHQAAVPTLDKLRQEAIAGTFLRDDSTGFLNWPTLLYRELVWPCRWIWSGLAAVWILIFAANFSLRDASPIIVAKSSSPQEVIMAWRQQQRLLTELIGPSETSAALPAKSYSPRPASRRQIEILAV